MEGDKVLIGGVSLENFLIFLFILFITIFVGNALYPLSIRLFEKRISIRRLKLSARLLQYFIFGMGLYFGLYHVLHLNISAFFASLGIVSIAIAFSSQQLIQNFLAGLLISIQRPIELEDWVEIGPSGVSKVKDLTLTRTILRNINGRLYFIPNSIVLSSNIINYTKSGLVEVNIPIVIRNGLDHKRIMELILEIAINQKGIFPNIKQEEEDLLDRFKEVFKVKMDPRQFSPKVFVSDITGINMALSARIWIKRIRERDEIVSGFLDSVIKRLKEENIELVKQ